ncbi:MAG: signal peptidase II [Rhodobacterales bacterium CG15_BIG_FIL_POST_REV_8_21_14_020_59_13]|nr:MAG: signal peptidase II [Rhodobacterales bacterium CG15_BIG_FIL_POST_REV_8_21_14_020_59_13]
MFQRRTSRVIPIAGFGLAVIVIALDQASKYWMLYGLDLINQMPGDRIEVFSFFHLTMVWNRGISFGLLQAQAFWQSLLLILFSLAVSGLLSSWMLKGTRWLQVTSYALIIGGALGNAIDRGIYGAVADFLDFSSLPLPFGYEFAWVFNVADVAINIGVLALLIDLLVNDRGSR